MSEKKLLSYVCLNFSTNAICRSLPWKKGISEFGAAVVRFLNPGMFKEIEFENECGSKK